MGLTAGLPRRARPACAHGEARYIPGGPRRGRARPPPASPSIPPPRARRAPGPRRPAGSPSTPNPDVENGQEQKPTVRQVRLPVRHRPDRGRRQPARAPRRQGRQPGRDGPPEAPRPRRLHHQHRGLHLVLRPRRRVPSRAAGADRRRPGGGGGDDGRPLRRPLQPAPALGALGGPRLDAGDDGDRPQPGPERPHRGRPHRAHRRRPVRVRRVPPLRADVRRRGDGPAPRRPGGDRSLRGPAGEEEGGPRRRARQRADRRRPRGAGGRVQGPHPAPPEARLPGGSRRAAPGRHRRRLRLLERRPGDPLPRAGGHPPRVGNGGQRAVHGLRQHGRGLRHRRRLHPRSLHRGEEPLRGVPGQRPGRGRGRRDPHAGAGGPPREGAAGGLPPVPAGLPPARAPLPGDAGPGVHDPERPPVDAADALRQAHRRGGGEDRRRHGEGAADLAEGGPQAGLPRGPRPAPAPLLRPRGPTRRHRPGSARLARRGHRPGGLPSRGRRGGGRRPGPG